MTTFIAWLDERNQRRNLRALHGNRPPHIWREMLVPVLGVAIIAMITGWTVQSDGGLAAVGMIGLWIMALLAGWGVGTRARTPIEYRCGWYDGRRAMRQSSWDALNHGLSWEVWIRAELIRDHANLGGTPEDLESAP